LVERTKEEVARIQLAKLQKADDAKKAMSEYEANQASVLERTEKLRAQRLAREAEAARNTPAPAKKKKAGGKSVKSQAGNLSDWLNDQKTSGRRS
jgi:hypothetical protein